MSDIETPANTEATATPTLGQANGGGVRGAVTCDQHSITPKWKHYMIITPSMVAHLRLEEGIVPQCYYLVSASMEPTRLGWGEMTPSEILDWKRREHGAMGVDFLRIDRLMMSLKRKFPEIEAAMAVAIQAAERGES